MVVMLNAASALVIVSHRKMCDNDESGVKSTRIFMPLMKICKLYKVTYASDIVKSPVLLPLAWPVHPARVRLQNNFTVLVVTPGDDIVQVRSESIRRLADLELYNGERTRRVSALEEICPIDHLTEDVVAIPVVAISRPGNCAHDRRGGIGAFGPFVGGDEEVVSPNATNEVLEEGIDGLVREASGGVRIGPDNAAVPDLDNVHRQV